MMSFFIRAPELFHSKDKIDGDHFVVCSDTSRELKYTTSGRNHHMGFPKLMVSPKQLFAISPFGKQVDWKHLTTVGVSTQHQICSAFNGLMYPLGIVIYHDQGMIMGISGYHRSERSSAVTLTCGNRIVPAKYHRLAKGLSAVMKQRNIGLLQKASERSVSRSRIMIARREHHAVFGLNTPELGSSCLLIKICARFAAIKEISCNHHQIRLECVNRIYYFLEMACFVVDSKMYITEQGNAVYMVSISRLNRIVYRHYIPAVE